MAWLGPTKPKTALESYAESIKQKRSSNEALSFPMYVLFIEVLLSLTEVKSHETLRQEGLLTQFFESMGQVIFISHQWLSKFHPDPESKQFKVLQEALRNMLSGESLISTDVSTEIFFGRPAINTAVELRSKPVYVWYDYFCCPQLEEQEKARAIGAIPEYIMRCAHFLVLTPPLKHVENSEIMSRYSWASRGWCRTERMARELSSEGLVILVQSSEQQTLLPQYESVFYSPGHGRFTVAEDKERIAKLTQHMIKSRLMHELQRGDLHQFRFFLNQQTIRLDSLPATAWHEVVPGFEAETSDVRVESFMYQNGFREVQEYDEGGWSPICFAAMKGDAELIAGLVRQGACPNDETRKSKILAHMPSQMKPLHLAACFRNNEAVRRLLQLKAEVNARDERGDGALHWACVSDNGEGVRILLEAGADPFMLAGPGASPFATACSTGSVNAAREMLTVPGVSLKDCFFWCMMFHGGSTQMVSTLVEAKADVNEAYHTSLQNLPLWMLMKVYSVKHYVNPSRLTYVAHNHQGATPLMFSVMNGHFEAATALVSKGASCHVRNQRGATAADLARDLLAPQELIDMLQGEVRRSSKASSNLA